MPHLFRPLTLLPQLLPFGFGSYFFAPTILRIAIAAVFVYLAITHYKNKTEVSKEVPWVSHEMAVWMTGILILMELGVAFGLFLGFWTQAVAVIGAILALKGILLYQRGKVDLAPLSSLSYVLVIVMCAVLVISGAGAFAFDLPL